MECPVCQENVRLLNLPCSHGICRSCLAQWSNHGGTTCPTCRADINQNILNRTFILSNLVDTAKRYLDISISSPKGTSTPVTDDELSKIQEVFGPTSQISNENFQNLDIGSKIMFQMYKSNCWFYGTIDAVDDTTIRMNNCIFLQRCDGSMYNTSPACRNIQFENNDSIYLIST
tara:strand:+ start:16 stop:537 length:522 start_codon:yes stop_codon:yes gene_type:complete